jgi:hypothetical protein
LNTRKKAARPKKFEWLNPETALYIGYNLYLASDPNTIGSWRRKVAVKEAQRLYNLAASPGSRDDFFLTEVRASLASYAGALARHKRIFTDEIMQVQREYDGKQIKIIGGLTWSALMAAAMKVGMLTIMFGIGFQLAKTIAPFIPQDFGEATGKAPPSYLLGFVFVVISRLISLVWEHYRQVYINKTYNEKKDIAWEQYGESRIREYRQHLYDLTEVWDAYTGKKYQVISSIESILEDDNMTRRIQVRRRERIASRNQFSDLAENVRKFLRRRLGRRRTLRRSPHNGSKRPEFEDSVPALTTVPADVALSAGIHAPIDGNGKDASP